MRGIQSLGVPSIIDIRQDVVQTNLKEEIIIGLTSEPKRLPAILMWDSKGLMLFERFAQSKEYYPAKKEIGILSLHADEIAKTIESRSVVIELGSGNLQKTEILLAALQRQQKSITYYALDLSFAELSRSLSSLADQFSSSSFIEIYGLLGTYDDGISWISQCKGLLFKPISILWLGNSIANLGPEEASGVLALFSSPTASGSIRKLSFLIAVDGCRDQNRIRRAYDPENIQLRAFILNGLQHANAVIGGTVFQNNDWDYEGSYDDQRHIHQDCYVAKEDVKFSIAGQDIRIRKNERVRATMSAKWTEEEVNTVCRKGGFEIVERWKDEEGSYGEIPEYPYAMITIGLTVAIIQVAICCIGTK